MLAARTSVLPAASHGPLHSVTAAAVPVPVLHLPLFLLVATGLLDVKNPVRQEGVDLILGVDQVSPLDLVR